jgi:hypothetical protein
MDSIFITFVQACKGNMCLINGHLHILNWHNSHVMKDIHKDKEVGLDLITLSSHKPFVTTFWSCMFYIFQDNIQSLQGHVDIC